MTRTDAILHALRKRLDARRAELDAAADLRHLVIELRFTPGERVTPYEVVDRIERGEKRTA
jgi:hypothetical protein